MSAPDSGIAASGIDTAALPLAVAWFDTAMPRGPAIGDPERTTWHAFTDVFRVRREGGKDGTNFVPDRFKLETDGRHVRRLKANLLARTAIALDFETNKKTGTALTVTPTEAASRASALGLACVVYSSHNHRSPDDIRFRAVFALEAEIAANLPAPEVMADVMGLADVLDTSKVGAASLFYLPSSPPGLLSLHETIVVPGAPIAAAWITERAGAILTFRKAERDRLAAEAHAEAAGRREAKIAAGINPDNSLIEKLRAKLDLGSILLAHGYAKSGDCYRHPNSQSGMFGADIKVFSGIERVYSHNAGDPLHAGNLPRWCTAKAIDAVDAAIILAHSGDRTKGLTALAGRFGLGKGEERKAIARLMFKMIKQQRSQPEIEAAVFAEGSRRGLSREEVCHVAHWVAGQATEGSAA
jgi:hypothetical protein